MFLVDSRDLGIYIRKLDDRIVGRVHHPKSPVQLPLVSVGNFRDDVGRSVT